MADLKNTTISDDSILYIPIRTTSNRPSNPQEGTIIYNSDIQTIEFFNGNKWKNYRQIGRTPEDAILDFGTIPEKPYGVHWINPALALGTGNRPIKVFIEWDKNQEPFVKLRVDLTNGIVTNSYSSTNSIDKVADEGPNPIRLGNFLGLGNVNLSRDEDIDFAVTLNAETHVTGQDDRWYQKIRYFNPATGTLFSEQEIQDIAQWANETSPFSYQFCLEVDDDNATFSDQSTSLVFPARTNSGQDPASGVDFLGHPVMIHSFDSNGEIYGYDGTNSGGFSSNNQGNVFLLTRSSHSSNSIIGTRYNTDEQLIYVKAGAALNDNIRRIGDQNEVLSPPFLIPTAVSLIITTGGGCAWAYLTYTDQGKSNSSLENFLLVKGTGYI